MKRLALILAMTSSLAIPARATSITGDVSLAGLNSYGPNFVDFINPADVLSATGTLAIMDNFRFVDMHNMPSLVGEPGKLLFNWNHFNEDIKMRILTLNIEENNHNFLNLKGTAEMSATGFSDTLYDWTLTSTSSGITSFTLDATVVPEPRSLTLLGIGLTSLAGLLYRARIEKESKENGIVKSTN